jgi:hypothetical protein
MCCDRTHLSAQAKDDALVEKIMRLTFGEVAELARAAELFKKKVRKGIPLTTNQSCWESRIFPVEESKIAIEHREFPPHWPRIGGMDFGWDHPFAAVELVWDRDSDTVYVSRTHRLREATPVLTCRYAPVLGQGIALGMAA